MGCDIHMITQAKLADGQWHTIEIDTYGHRNYEVFGALSGVRSGRQVIAHPKGLPEDFKYTVRKEGGVYVKFGRQNFFLGEHSFNWLTVKELLSYDWSPVVPLDDDQIDERVDYWDGGFREIVINHLIYLERFQFDKEHIRIVFGFDS